MTDSYIKATEPYKDIFTTKPIINPDTKVNEQIAELLTQLKRAETFSAQRGALIGYLLATLTWYFDKMMPAIKHSIWDDMKNHRFVVHRNQGHTSTKPLDNVELGEFFKRLVKIRKKTPYDK